MNFDDLPAFDVEGRFQSDGPHGHADALINRNLDIEARSESAVVAVVRAICLIGIVIASGVITVFAIDLYVFFKPMQGYLPASIMPWTAAGLVSSIVGMLMLMLLFFSTKDS